MANMSYCRFENTSSDVEDCVIALQEAECLEDMDLSSYEKSALHRMYDLCKEFIERCDELELDTFEVR